jgi:triosephosphate isomerase (TIM)
MIFINFKTYPEATGDNAVKLALACEVASEELKVPIIPVVQTTDIWRIKQHTHIPVWAQHVDDHAASAHTGFTTIEAILAAGAAGTILNHSEHQLPFPLLERTVKRIRGITKELNILICANNEETLQQIAPLQPDYIAYEPPELIGDPEKSVATEKADIIAKSVELANNIPLIVGAGIKNANDIKVSLDKGAKGVLIASAVVKTDNPIEKLRELGKSFSDRIPLS